MRFPMFIDDEDETAQEPEESNSPRFQEPLPNTSVVEESKEDECLPENKNEFDKGEPEKENENFVKSHENHKEGLKEMEIDDIEKSEGINLPTHETNFVLKQPQENDEERRVPWSSREILRTLKENNPYAMKKCE
ncbi:hypothetical protein M9H77_04233 [Catharanthus roseus]|uniref:Uncharacterized protein n=1 Tax=Catharanthus roseus TaxID=4058 RepID=A0ACC0CDN1_CATRO|nr:hypothetical protein M9H77_04233 [Catharanthus roseus]